MNVNFKGTLLCSIEAARVMRDQGGGCIVFSSWVFGLRLYGVRELGRQAACRRGRVFGDRQLQRDLRRALGQTGTHSAKI